MATHDPDQICVVIQHVFTFTEKQTELIKGELLGISDSSGATCEFNYSAVPLRNRETIKITGYSQPQVDKARTLVFALLRKGLPSENVRTRQLAIELPRKKSKAKPEVVEKKKSKPRALPSHDLSDDEQRYGHTETSQKQTKISTVFTLDRGVNSYQEFLSKYGVEHLPPTVPGSVDHLREILKQTGVEATIAGRDMMISGTDHHAIQDTYYRLQTLQTKFLNPPPASIKPVIVVYQQGRNIPAFIKFAPVKKTRNTNYSPPLPFALRTGYDIVEAQPGADRKQTSRRSSTASTTSTSSLPVTTPRSYSTAAKTAIPVERDSGSNVLPASYMESITRALRDGLEHGRRWRGEVSVEAKLGSVVVSGLPGSNRNENIEFDRIQRFFGGENPKLNFSDVATASQNISQRLFEHLSEIVSPKVVEKAKEVSITPSYAQAGTSNWSIPTPVPEVAPKKFKPRRESRFVLTCRARADTIHPWTIAKLILDAGTLQPIRVIPKSSTVLADVYWKNIGDRWDWRLRAKGRHHQGKTDVKPFITFIKKLSFSPQKGGIAYENIPGLFEVQRLKHKLSMFLPIGEGNDECIVTKMSVLSTSGESANAPGTSSQGLPKSAAAISAVEKAAEELETLTLSAKSDDGVQTKSNGVQTKSEDRVQAESDEGVQAESDEGVQAKADDGDEDAPLVLYDPEDDESVFEDPANSVESPRKPPIKFEDEDENEENQDEDVDHFELRDAARIDDPNHNEDPPEPFIEAAPEVDADGMPIHHYTVKVRSKRWKTLFDENITMEIGKVASWTPDEIFHSEETRKALNQTSFAVSWESSMTSPRDDQELSLYNTLSSSRKNSAAAGAGAAAAQPNDELVSFLESMLKIGYDVEEIGRNAGEDGWEAPPASIQLKPPKQATVLKIIPKKKS